MRGELDQTEDAVDAAIAAVMHVNAGLGLLAGHPPDFARVPDLSRAPMWGRSGQRGVAISS